MSSTNFELVGDFQQEILGVLAARDGIQMPVDPVLSMMQLTEELFELNAALAMEDPVEIADALVDLIYFAYGVGWQMNLPMDKLFRIVHDANMLKRKGVTKRGHQLDAFKPEGWVDPKILIKELLSCAPR